MASVLQHTPSPKVTCKVPEKIIVLKYLKYVHRSSQVHQLEKKKKTLMVVLFCNSGKIIKSFITIEREYKEELGVPSCGVSCYYYLATKSHWWELCVLCPQEPAWKKCLKIISWINKCKKGIGMKWKFALESYAGRHFDKTSDVLSFVGLEMVLLETLLHAC